MFTSVWGAVFAISAGIGYVCNIDIAKCFFFASIILCSSLMAVIIFIGICCSCQKKETASEGDDDLLKQQYYDDGVDFGFAFAPVIFLIFALGIFGISVVCTKLMGGNPYWIYTMITLCLSILSDFSNR